MKVVALVGSLRKDSFNKHLVETIGKRYSHLFEVEIADLGILPHYNEDDEHNPAEEVKKFKKQIADADAVMISTPEFNWSIPGALKNALDWTSRVERPLVGKPVLPMGVSQGALGTVRAQLHLRQVLTSNVGAKLMPPAGNEIFIGAAGQKFTDGTLTDETTLQFLDQVIEKFVAFAKEQETK
ncbi:NAD(P)H-dependent oxidoreductase [Sporosarcina sp. ACRSM]|uniref:NADPH-dependent FMN reductase n=1 Tax=Sporosarcina sp. ACRSM TaxID=2918216 RepID=UPI001EF4A59D|nr:NADPH-dependent FMN reductase [Sporosarcina sp. ACRSM]MCG7334786.1 NAD(P)H-dependent oxidoreductase [Sporosarcina sp. ACRSM]